MLFSVQLQLLILSNGTTIPVSAEEGLQLLSDSGIEAALVPFGYSVVHFQAGMKRVITRATIQLCIQSEQARWHFLL